MSGYFTEYAGMKFGCFISPNRRGGHWLDAAGHDFPRRLGAAVFPSGRPDEVSSAMSSSARARAAYLDDAARRFFAFFGKVLVVCWLQVFVRWTLASLPLRPAHESSVWRILLPSSLANILVTGIVWLALDKAGAGCQLTPEGGAGDATQAIVVVAITYLVVRALLGFFSPVTHQRTLLGSSAEVSARRGAPKPSDASLARPHARASDER